MLKCVMKNSDTGVIVLRKIRTKDSPYLAECVGWVGVTVDTFSENGTVLSYKLTEGNHIGDGNIWEFCLTDAHFNKFENAS